MQKSQTNNYPHGRVHGRLTTIAYLFIVVLVSFTSTHGYVLNCGSVGKNPLLNSRERYGRSHVIPNYPPIYASTNARIALKCMSDSTSDDTFDGEDDAVASSGADSMDEAETGLGLGLSEEALGLLASNLIVPESDSNSTSFSLQKSSLSTLNSHSLLETPRILSSLSSYYSSLRSGSKSGLSSIFWPDDVTPLLLNPLNSNSPSLVTGSTSIIKSLTEINDPSGLQYSDVKCRVLGWTAITVNVEVRNDAMLGRKRSRFDLKKWRNVVVWRRFGGDGSWRAVMVCTEAGGGKERKGGDSRELNWKELKEEGGKGKIIISSLGGGGRGTTLGGLLGLGGLGGLVDEEEEEDENISFFDEGRIEGRGFGSKMGGGSVIRVGGGGGLGGLSNNNINGNSNNNNNNGNDSKTNYLETKVIKDIKRIFEKGRISGEMKRKFISDIVRDRVEGVESPIVVGWEILEGGDEDFEDFLIGQYERAKEEEGKE
ncbi:hypothetical protein TrVE_jg7454 [Triparma verrucosa]|uniref:Uncharacterized protein n=1 Tax=Triparma verrucosa TaxID=1606542 RepID=A0A9W7F5M8_9STRA|nr:hypothetical protein TrVE_jg7454 [Triparma verrucosa]